MRERAHKFLETALDCAINYTTFSSENKNSSKLQSKLFVENDLSFELLIFTVTDTPVLWQRPFVAETGAKILVTHTRLVL